MSDIQKPTGPCFCGRTVRYVQRDPWAFDFRCEVCGAAGVLCWDEGDTPPTFQPQPDLFSEVQA